MLQSRRHGARGAETEASRYLKKQAELLALLALHVTVRRVVRGGDPAEELLRAAEAHAAPLLALRTHGRTGPGAVGAEQRRRAPAHGHPASIRRCWCATPISIPGVATVITGIGQVNREDPARDQLVANLAATVDTPATEMGRRWIEDWVAQYHGTDTNYFQEPAAARCHPGPARR